MALTYVPRQKSLLEELLPLLQIGIGVREGMKDRELRRTLQQSTQDFQQQQTLKSQEFQKEQTQQAFKGQMFGAGATQVPDEYGPGGPPSEVGERGPYGDYWKFRGMDYQFVKDPTTGRHIMETRGPRGQLKSATPVPSEALYQPVTAGKRFIGVINKATGQLDRSQASGVDVADTVVTGDISIKEIERRDKKGKLEKVFQGIDDAGTVHWESDPHYTATGEKMEQTEEQQLRTNVYRLYGQSEFKGLDPKVSGKAAQAVRLARRYFDKGMNISEASELAYHQTEVEYKLRALPKKDRKGATTDITGILDKHYNYIATVGTDVIENALIKKGYSREEVERIATEAEIKFKQPISQAEFDKLLETGIESEESLKKKYRIRRP